MTRIAVAAFAASLHLYPATFREEYGREMTRLLADSLRNAEGGAHAVLLWLQAMAGVLIGAPREHVWLLLADLRYAARTLRHAKWFTLTALFTLALGIGANTAIFSVVETLLLRQLPYRAPDRIAMVWVKNPEQGFDHDVTSYPRFEDWRAQSGTIEAFAAYSGMPRVLTGGGDPEQVSSVMVTADFFTVMGAQAALGRGFSPGDDDFGRPPQAVLSHRLWVRRFGADPGIVGQTITMSGKPYSVIGVMPSTFRYPTRDTDLWEPLALSPDQRRQRSAYWLTTVARLKAGVSLTQARQEMDAISGRLAAQYTEDRSLGVDLVTLRDELTASTRPALVVLTAAVALVLLIACANVAGMLIARASDRQAEIALRAALGAGRGRVVRQLLTEAVVLFVVGGVLGLALAAAGVRAIVRLAPTTLPQIREVEVNWTVGLYAISLAALAGLVFGSAPALQAASRDQADALRGGSPRTAGRRRGAAWFRTSLLASQVALAFVLLTGAALLLRSFARMQAVDLGFDPRGVVAARLSLPGARYDSASKAAAFHEAVTERLRAIPGVESAAGISTFVLDRLPNSARFQIQGRSQDVVTPLTYDTVTPDFFTTLRIPLLRGRLFTDADGPTSQRVTIINQTTAERYWPHEDPVGQSLRFGGGADNDNPWMAIVGVVADTRRAGLDVPVFTESYQPMRQAASRSLDFLVRTRKDAPAIGPAIPAAVREIDPQQPVSTIAPLESILDETLAARRFNTLLVTIFAVAALLLAAMGVYGLLAYLIAQQHREIGIRMALGARGAAILKAVGGRALTAAGLGGIVGVGASVAVSRAMGGLLFGIAPLDAVSYSAAACVLAAVVATAAAVPLGRALSIDPAVSLRAD